MFTLITMGKYSVRTKWRTAFSVILSACIGGLTSCSHYDLDEYDPAGWGSSIYNYLDESGNYTNTLKLINDLGLKEVLAKTGSKTLFVADDDAFDRFYSNNGWGVKDYSQFTDGQKKMLLLGCMIDNSYQVKDLASVEGPVEGQSFRRVSSMSVYDSVSVVKPSDLPNMQPGDEVHNRNWLKFRNRDNVVLMHDMTNNPVTYFVEAALSNYKITNDDYAFLFNGKTTRTGNDASVNGVKIEQQNIKCSNGFIHKMAEVTLPLNNMSDIIASKPNVSIYAKLLQRFAAPFYIGRDNTDHYNYLHRSNVDSVFQLRYFSEKSQGGQLSRDDELTVHHELLRYDPGWNTYYNNPIPSAELAMEKDMGVMLVPSDEAMQNYWDKGEGKVLKEQYGTWDNVPNDVIIELINNNMLYSLIASVPSKFGNILNDANDPMGITKESIDEVCLGNNGAVYVTSTVYPPTSFVSVLYPAIINESMKIMRWAVEKNNYKVYLNSLNVPGGYSFFIPNNDAFLSYIDPVSYAGSMAVLYRFHYDSSLSNPVWASRYYYDMENDEIKDSIDEIRNNDYVMQRKLKEVLDNHIVIGNVEDGNTYYRTKGGQEIKVERVTDGANGMTVSGSLPISEGKEGVQVINIYDQTGKGNGKAYILDKPIMTTRKTVLDILGEHPEMAEFRKLLEGSSLVSEDNSKKRFVGKGINVFNTYHYTIYVPSNESILKLQNNGELPTWDAVQQAINEEDEVKAEALTKKIEDFLKYHIQDYALFIGAKQESEEGYETALINDKGKFERLYCTLTDKDIIIKNSLDSNAKGYIQAKVQKEDGLYNLQAREYLLDAEDYDVNKSDLLLYTSSTAVIHLIDQPLKVVAK